MTEYDAIIIGTGQAGPPLAARLTKAGMKVAIVERKLFGGTCVNTGCIPTKTLVASARTAAVTRRAQEYGVLVDGQIRIDMKAVKARKDKISAASRTGLETYLKSMQNCAVYEGQAQFESPREIAINGELIGAQRIFINVGGRAIVPDMPGLDRVSHLTNSSMLDIDFVPEHLVIVGGSYIGLEFAQMYRRFGSEVTIIELLPRLVPVEDEAVSAELEKSFRKQGIKTLTGTKVTRAAAGANGVDIEAQTPDGQTQKLTADLLLVATGRGPVTTGLGVEQAGIAMEKGYIKVDELYRTSVPNISAIGDVITLGKGVHPQLAHVSSAEGILVAERIAGEDVRPINYDHVPSCTYCDPEIGSVGLTEAEARQKGYDVRIGSFPFGVLGRAKMAGETEGFVKIVADKKYDEILGIHMIGPRSTELVAEAVLALRLECTVEELIKTIHAHPTFSEAVGEAAHATHGAAIHL